MHNEFSSIYILLSFHLLWKLSFIFHGITITYKYIKFNMYRKMCRYKTTLFYNTISHKEKIYVGTSRLVTYNIGEVYTKNRNNSL